LSYEAELELLAEVYSIALESYRRRRKEAAKIVCGNGSEEEAQKATS